MRGMRYRVVLLDLFRTVIAVHPEAPTMRVTEPSWRAAMEPLRTPLELALPGVSFRTFLDTLIVVTSEIARARAPEYLEIPVRTRYRWTFLRLGVDETMATTAAERFAMMQMNLLLQHTSLPAEHRTLLQALAASFRLGLISNFDHAPAVRAVLSRHGIDALFAAVVVSDECGRRKPHPAIFHEALRRMQAAAAEALYVGDSLVEDIGGAAAAGIDGIWLNPTGAAAPSDGPQPRAMLSRLTDLPALLHRLAVQ